MDPTTLIGKAIGRFVAKLGLKRAFRWAKKWYYHNVKNEKTPMEKLQKSAKRREQLEERNQRKDERLAAKDELLEEREEKIADVARDLSVKERLIEALEIEGISRQELFRKNIDDPTPFLIFRMGGQRPELDDGRGWVREKLEAQFGARTVGSSYVIPPESFPEDLLAGELTLAEWIEKELDEEDKEANFVYVSWVDMEQGELYWRKDYESRSPMPVLEERFDLEGYAKKDFYDFDEVRDALQLVKKGDIAFFAAKFVDEDEIRAIHESQASIEEDLGNPSLKQLATVVEVEDLELALEDYVSDSDNVAQGVTSEVGIWYEELYGSPTIEIGSD